MSTTREEPKMIDALPAKDKRKLQGLIEERAVLGYAFSYRQLHKLLAHYISNETELLDALHNCIEAVDDKQEKEAKAGLNDGIAEILQAHELRGVRTADPFGDAIDTAAYSSSTSSLSKTKLVELAPSYGISTTKMLDLIEKSTTSTEYAAVRITRVKE